MINYFFNKEKIVQIKFFRVFQKIQISYNDCTYLLYVFTYIFATD